MIDVMSKKIVAKNLQNISAQCVSQYQLTTARGEGVTVIFYENEGILVGRRPTSRQEI